MVNKMRFCSFVVEFGNCKCEVTRELCSADLLQKISKLPPPRRDSLAPSVILFGYHENPFSRYHAAWDNEKDPDIGTWAKIVAKSSLM